MLLSLPTSAKQLPKPRPTRAGWHSHENQGNAAPACAAQPLELAAEPCQAERSRARGAQRERSAEQEHSPASPGPAQPDRDLARLKPSPSLRPSENLLLPAGLFPAIYGAGLTRCPCERPSPGKQLPRACSPNRGALPVLLPCPTVHTQTRPTPALVAEACTLQVTLLGMLLPFSVLLPAPHHPQPLPWLLSSPKVFWELAKKYFSPRASPQRQAGSRGQAQSSQLGSQLRSRKAGHVKGRAPFSP